LKLKKLRKELIKRKKLYLAKEKGKELVEKKNKTTASSWTQ
jgi:hypothetical protein